MFLRCFCVSFLLIVQNMCNFASPRHAVKEIAWSHSLLGNHISHSLLNNRTFGRKKTEKKTQYYASASLCMLLKRYQKEPRLPTLEQATTALIQSETHTGEATRTLRDHSLRTSVCLNRGASQSRGKSLIHNARSESAFDIRWRACTLHGQYAERKKQGTHRTGRSQSPKPPN